MKKFKVFKIFTAMLLLACTVVTMAACGSKKETVMIYASLEDYRIEFMQGKLAEKFPQYDIRVEYIPTGNHAAKLLAEGTNTECDIIYDLDYGYLMQLDEKGILANLSAYDKSIYTEDAVVSDNFVPSTRYGGAIIYDPVALEEKGIAKPENYEDLLDPAYSGLISWASPKASNTGYMFLDALSNAWGEEKALDYFDQLAPSVIQFTSSGSGPVNAIIQKEAVLGVCALELAATKIKEGYPIEIAIFDEGAPYSLCGASVVNGKLEKPAVKEVFDYLLQEFMYEDCEKYATEKIFKDKDYTSEGMPEHIDYAEMSPISPTHKTELLDKWVH